MVSGGVQTHHLAEGAPKREWVGRSGPHHPDEKFEKPGG